MSTLPADFNSLPLPQQNQILAWMQDLSTGQADQGGANQAVAGLAGYGAAPPSNSQFSTFNGTDGLNYTPLPLPVAGPSLSPPGGNFQQSSSAATAPSGIPLTVGPQTTGITPFTNPLAGNPNPVAGNVPATSQAGPVIPRTNPLAMPANAGNQPNPLTQGQPSTPINYTQGGAPPGFGNTYAPAQGSSFNPADQTNGLTYTSQPGNFPTGTPMVPNNFDPQFLQNYGAATGGALNAIGNAYGSAPWGTMNAAQMNTGAVPQVGATLPQTFDALQFLLSGQGFDPATLARMRAQATDSVAQSAAGTMSAARLAAERAGLLNSGEGIGLQANVANQAGIQNQQLQNQIAIQNAQQGIQNLQAGAGMNLNLQENSAAQANQVALQNAANLFSSMTQNLANQQATNAANFAGQQQKALGQAQAQSQYATGAGQNLQNSMTQQFYGANVNNANIGNQQWGTAGGWLNNLANYGSPYGAVNANTSAASSTNPNTSLGNTLLGYGAATGTQKPAGG